MISKILLEIFASKSFKVRGRFRGSNYSSWRTRIRISRRRITVFIFFTYWSIYRNKIYAEIRLTVTRKYKIGKKCLVFDSSFYQRLQIVDFAIISFRLDVCAHCWRKGGDSFWIHLESAPRIIYSTMGLKTENNNSNISCRIFEWPKLFPYLLLVNNDCELSLDPLLSPSAGALDFLHNRNVINAHPFRGIGPSPKFPWLYRFRHFIY